MSDHEHDQTYHQQMKHLNAELEKGIPSGRANYRKSLTACGLVQILPSCVWVKVQLPPMPRRQDAFLQGSTPSGPDGDY